MNHFSGNRIHIADQIKGNLQILKKNPRLFSGDRKSLRLKPIIKIRESSTASVFYCNVFCITYNTIIRINICQSANHAGIFIILFRSPYYLAITAVTLRSPTIKKTDITDHMRHLSGCLPDFLCEAIQRTFLNKPSKSITGQRRKYRLRNPTSFGSGFVYIQNRRRSSVCKDNIIRILCQKSKTLSLIF